MDVEIVTTTNDVIGRSTVGRSGTPDELAGVIIMLASDAGGYVNGQTIAVDSGMSIRSD